MAHVQELTISSPEQLTYRCGEERQIISALLRGRRPIVVRMCNPPAYDLRDLSSDVSCTYYRGNSNALEARTPRVVERILSNEPIRVFAAPFTAHNKRVLADVPLLRQLPRLRRYFFGPEKAVEWFTGGAGVSTPMHYDREANALVHLCLWGRKTILMCTNQDTRYIYKTPLFSDSIVDFDVPLEKNAKRYPNLRKARWYRVVLEPGDMVYLPPRCWHYVRYTEPSLSCAVGYYTNRLVQIGGCISGLFYMSTVLQTKFFDGSTMRKLSRRYALATGLSRWLYRGLELFLQPFLYAIFVPRFFIKNGCKGAAVYNSGLEERRASY